MIFRLLAALVIVAVIVGSVILDRERRGPVVPRASTGTAGDTGYAARDAELVETGADGRPMYTVNAERIRQLPEKEIVTLERVRMRFRDANGGVWTLSAAEGLIRGEGTLIDLTGDVRVNGMPPGTSEPAVIVSERLTFDTRAEVVSTDEPVILEWSGRRMSARGLVASLKGHRVQLESNVHGVFSP